MWDDDTLRRSREAAERWRKGYDRMLDRFGDAAPARAKQPTTDSGLPLQPCYFPHDVADRDFERIGGNIADTDLGVHEMILCGDTDTGAAATQIKNPLHLAAVGPGFEVIGDQLGNRRTRHKHALVDVKSESAKPGLSGDISGGLARFNA